MERSPKRKKSIVVSGYYGYRNMGDDAILHMICRDYADDCELTVLTLRPKETEGIYHVKTVNRFHMAQVRRAIKDADLLISGGGSLLQDKTSTRSLLYYLTIIKLAQHYGVPSVLYAAGIGPIRSEENLRRVAAVLRGVDLITLREEASVSFLERLCPGKPALLTADPVFHMEPSPDSTAEEILRQNGLGDAPMFAVSIRKTGREEALRLAELLDRIAAASGCMPIFLCMQDPADYDAARSVQTLMKERSHVLLGCRSGPDCIAVLRRMRGVVSMRLHALIFGAVAGVPLMGFNVDPKLEALLHTLHGPEPVDLQCFEPAETTEQAVRIMAEGKPLDIKPLAAMSRELPHTVRRLLLERKERLVMHLISGGDTGGAKTHVLSLLRGLMEQGCRVLLVCFMEGSFSEEARAMGIPVRILPRNEISGNVKWLSRYIRHNRPDAVHCHGSRANFFGALLASRVSVPIVTTIHSDPWLDYLDRPGADRVFGRINRLSLKKIPWQICVSDELQELMAGKGVPKERLFRIPNGMDLARFSASVSRQDWYALHGLTIPADAVVFGTAARLAPVKDLSTLITAFSRVVDRYPSARLLIAGEGSESEKLRHEAEKLCPKGSAHFVGWLEDTASFYQALDVNVLTSLSEGFPYAILEGGRMRCATIATRVGNIPKAITDNETGFLIEPGDIAALFSLMCRMIEEPETRKRLGDALYEKIGRDYSLESMVRAQLAIYDEICASGRGDAGI